MRDVQKQAVKMRVDSLAGELSKAGLNVNACYQCRRCTNGCPVAFAMDLYPDEVIRRVMLNHVDRVLGCNTIWVCSGCETCTTRCPNEVDIAGVMDGLKEMALRSGREVPQRETYVFHDSFLKEIEKRGRVFEGGLMQRYMIRSGDFLKKMRDGSIFKDMALGFKMLRKGRMPLVPVDIKGKEEVRELIKRAK
jgi:heterodisulfide reductase subunit C